MGNHGFAAVALILLLSTVVSVQAYIDTDQSGTWLLESDVTSVVYGEEFVFHWKAPIQVEHDIQYITYTGFGTNDYTTTVNDQYIDAYRANVQHNETVDQICAMIRRRRGSPIVAPAIDTTVYTSLNQSVTGSSFQQFCFPVGVNVSPGWHYFGTKCLNCNGQNKIRYQTDVDVTAYYYYDGSSWWDSGESYNIWAETQWDNVSTPDDGVLQLVHADGDVVNISAIVANESYNEIEKFYESDLGRHTIYLKNGVGSIMAELKYWVLKPTQVEILNSMNVVPQGVRSAEINKVVEQSWSFFNPFNVTFSNVSCNIFLLADNSSKILTDVEPFSYNFSLNGKSGMFIVDWLANDSVIDEGNSYETACSLVGSFNNESVFTKFSQYVHITRTKSIWQKLLDIWEKLLGIEQKVETNINLTNETLIIVKDINRTVHNMNVTAEVNTSQIFEDNPVVDLGGVVDDGTGILDITALVRRGSGVVDDALCNATVLAGNGTVVASGNLSLVGGGRYTGEVASGGVSVEVACTLNDGKVVRAFGPVQVIGVRMEALS